MVALAKPPQHREHSLPLDTVVHGDALAVLRTLPDESVDAICCDPPAGISFMNKAFDHDKGGRDFWIAWLTQIMREAIRCLRPGGHAFVWALPRTSHWTATALENAGFEIRDCITHLFGSGFPKSLDVGKAIDKHFKAEREVIGKKVVDGGWHHEHTINDDGWKGSQQYITAPATPEAQQWAGYGSALKPANEHWWLCRKPLAEKSIAENVLTWGTGGINIDGCRIGYEPHDMATRIARTGDHAGECYGHDGNVRYSGGEVAPVNPSGRFPSNTLFSHSLFCVPTGEKRVRSQSGGPIKTKDGLKPHNVYGDRAYSDFEHYHDKDGMETIQAYQCVDGCPVKALDEMGHGTRSEKPSASGKGGWRNQYVGGDTPAYLDSNAKYHDTGGLSRYFQQFSPDVPFIYAPKASRRERNSGCEGLPEKDAGILDARPSGDFHTRMGDGPTQPRSNNHPTVKSQQLMRYLVRMITPPGGIVLDMFAGSGSTLVAAIHEGMHFIGIEQNDSEQEPYCTIARSRIAQAYKDCGIVKQPEALPVRKARTRKKMASAGLWEVSNG